MNNQPIGIFDSGIGGLTVAKAVIDLLPNENIIYLGDTARVPYGTRSREVITKFALELVSFLLTKKVKALVVACNTISANALDAITRLSPVPVIDVIAPTVAEAAKITKDKRIGVIGTAGTIENGAYQRFMTGSDPVMKVFAQACPLFVPLAEEGLTTGKAAEIIARGYLSELKGKQIDILILGCTHFPLLSSVIAKTMGDKVKLIESGPATAKKLREILKKNGLLQTNSKPVYTFYFTDVLEKVAKVAKKFFGQKLPGKIVKIEL